MPSPRYAREMPQRYRLEASKCKKCGKVFFPPRLICSNCRGREFDKIRLSDQGKIITFTTIRVAPDQFNEQVPYSVAIVELNEGVRITTQVVDCKPEDMAIGKPVKMVFRKIQEEGKTGIICYGYKATLS
jgi:uncharacterized OB-fold protein